MLTVATTILALFPGFFLGLTIDAFGARWGLWAGDGDDASELFIAAALLAVALLVAFLVTAAKLFLAAHDTAPRRTPLVLALILLAAVAIQVGAIVLI